MGLTLNSNSLTLGSAGGGGGSSGLTEAQVDARIAAKTPWTFISQVDVSTSTGYVELPLEGNYTTYKLLGDKIAGTSYNYPYIRYAQASGGITSGYGLGFWYGDTGGTYNYSGAQSEIFLTNSGSDWDKNFEFVFTTTSNSTRPVYRWTYGGGTSTYDPKMAVGGGQLNISTSTEITGIQCHMNTGNIASGSFKLYGLNNHA